MKRRNAVKIWIGFVFLWVALLWGCGCDSFLAGPKDMEGEGTQDSFVQGEGANQWEIQSAMQIVSRTYIDEKGNRIVYYCGKRMDGEKEDGPSLWRMILEGEEPAEMRECSVGQRDGFFCRSGQWSYLCWAIPPQYQCLIQYDADAVSEEDILQMATGVVLEAEK